MPQLTVARPPEIVTRQDDTRISTCLTGKGQAAALLVRVRDGWDTFSPSQRAEVADLVDRLSQALRREHSVSARTTTAVRVPLLARITA